MLTAASANTRALHSLPNDLPLFLTLTVGVALLTAVAGFLLLNCRFDPDFCTVDRGPGVRDALKERIFAPFQRFGDVPAGNVSASGLLSRMAQRRPPRTYPAARSPLSWTCPGGGTAPDSAGGGGHVTRVLVVDGDPQIVRVLSITLRARAFEVEAAPDGRTALELAASWHPDVMILDLGLPDMDGVDVLRGWSRVPVVVLSARRDSDEKVQALDEGADDYLTKPFGMDDLFARLCAAVRRAQPAEESAVIEAEAFTVDLTAKAVVRAGVTVRLTPIEWSLLEILVRNRGRLVAQRQLLRDVWGPAYENETNYLRDYLAHLGRKLEPDPSRPRHLITEPTLPTLGAAPASARPSVNAIGVLLSRSHSLGAAHACVSSSDLAPLVVMNLGSRVPAVLRAWGDNRRHGPAS